MVWVGGGGGDLECGCDGECISNVAEEGGGGKCRSWDELGTGREDEETEIELWIHDIFHFLPPSPQPNSKHPSPTAPSHAAPLPHTPHAPPLALCPQKNPNPPLSVRNVITLPFGKKNTSPFPAFTLCPLSSEISKSPSTMIFISS